ncbi:MULTISPECIES: Crp/Fnr family transcriptional regulator [Persicobacter]|uniref:Crp/Fnr family transcriptional regulator n=1 Tax=Persicobacter TaxID=59740 RepID=UPI0006A94B26|nr:Crp/Fnr family transcriptional regulator [Persicobacter sp. CCB-QB2]
MAVNKVPKNTCDSCPRVSQTLFDGVNSEELVKVSENKSCIRYKKGQTLYYEGTRPLGLFCVNGGKVKVFKMSSDGKEHIVHLAKDGDFLGYKDLIGEEFYTTSATVLEDSIICYIPKTNFLSLLQGNPVFFNKVTKAIIKSHGILENKLLNIAQKSVRERLAATLLMLKETYGMEGNEQGVLLDIALTREDLANIIGTATETVIRLLSEFKSEGMVALQGKKIRIINEAALVKTADFYEALN